MLPIVPRSRPLPAARFAIMPAMLLGLLTLALTASLPAAPAFATKSLTAKAAGVAPASEPAAPAKSALVDLNSASKPDLMKLPAVGDAISDKIIAGRPWRSKFDLVVKKVVTRSAYDKFSKLVVARQAGSK